MLFVVHNRNVQGIATNGQVDSFIFYQISNQEIMTPTGIETFANKRKLAKLLRELKLTPLSHNNRSPLVFLACL